MLPVGKLVNKYCPSLPSTCPLCFTPDEDHRHILRCPHPTRAAWRQDTLRKLRIKGDTLGTDPILLTLLLQGLSSWLNQTFFDTSGTPPRYCQLLLEQHEIGWHQLLMGRFSLQWARLQQTHLSAQQPIKGRSGDRWTSQMATLLLRAWLDLWELRNQDRHGKDAALKAKAKKEQTLRELELLYALRPQVLQKDRSLFFATYDQHTDKPTHLICQWIHTYCPVLLKSAKDAHLRSLLNVRTITSYFGTLPSK